MNKDTAKAVSGPDNEIAETDIIFECPHCAKSMAIDRRGAGLMISCPDCGKRIQVPVQDDLDIALDAYPRHAGTTLDQHVRNLTQALDQSRGKVQHLMQLLEEARQRRTVLEKKRIQEAGRLGKISDELSVIQSAIDRIAGHLQDGIAEQADNGSNW